MKLNSICILFVKLIVAINLFLILIGLLKRQEEFFTKDMLIVVFFSVLYLFFLSVKTRRNLIANLIINYFYLSFFIVASTISGFGHLLSLNYPTYAFFRFDRSEESGDIIILVPIFLLSVNFIFNHFLLFKWQKDNPTTKPCINKN